MSIKEYDTYKIPSYLICPIEYGDYSGLDDDEIADLEAFLESLPDGNKIWEWEDEAYFSHYNDVSNLGGQVVDAKLFVDIDDEDSEEFSAPRSFDAVLLPNKKEIKMDDQSRFEQINYFQIALMQINSSIGGNVSAIEILLDDVRLSSREQILGQELVALLYDTQHKIAEIQSSINERKH